MKKFICVLLVVVLLCGCLVVPSNAVVAETLVVVGGAALVAALIYAGATATSMNKPDMSGLKGWFDGLANPLNLTAKFDPVTGTITMDSPALNNAIDYIGAHSTSENFTQPPAFNVSGDFDYSFGASGLSSQNGVLSGSGGAASVTWGAKFSNNINPATWTYPSSAIDIADLPAGTVVSMSGRSAAPDTASYPIIVWGRNASNYYGVIQSSADGVNWAYNSYINSSGVGTVATYPTSHEYVRICVYARTYVTSVKYFDAGQTVPVQGNFPSISIDLPAFAGKDAVDFTQTIPDNIDTKKVPDPSGNMTSMTFADQYGNNMLAGMTNQQAMDRLIDAYLNGEMITTQTSTMEGEIGVVTPEDYSGSIYQQTITITGVLQGIWGSITSLPQSIANSFTGFFDNIREYFATLSEALSNFFDDQRNRWRSEDEVTTKPKGIPPLFMAFGLDHIIDTIAAPWAYVAAWLGSIASGAAFFWGVFNGLPYGLLIPVYATAAIALVVGLWKRYIA